MRFVESGPLPAAAAILATATLSSAGWSTDRSWTATDAETIRRAGARDVRGVAHAAHLLGAQAGRLVAGIEVEAPLIANGVFGPLWRGHPFASADFNASFRLREPDITRGLERLMSSAAGSQGTRRAITFLSVLADISASQTLHTALVAGIQPVVGAEHPIRVAAETGRGANLRIDLLFRWPSQEDFRVSVVVVEAKFGAVVGQSQLVSYRREAVRLAEGGSVTCILLTMRPDPAERRNPSWKALRWPALMRRWEREIAATGDDDPEFTRLCAHIWRQIRP